MFDVKIKVALDQWHSENKWQLEHGTLLATRFSRRHPKTTSQFSWGWMPFAKQINFLNKIDIQT